MGRSPRPGSRVPSSTPLAPFHEIATMHRSVERTYPHSLGYNLHRSATRTSVERAKFGAPQRSAPPGCVDGSLARLAGACCDGRVVASRCGLSGHGDASGRQDSLCATRRTRVPSNTQSAAVIGRVSHQSSPNAVGQCGSNSQCASRSRADKRTGARGSGLPWGGGHISTSGLGPARIPARLRGAIHPCHSRRAASCGRRPALGSSIA